MKRKLDGAESLMASSCMEEAPMSFGSGASGSEFNPSTNEDDSTTGLELQRVNGRMNLAKSKYWKRYGTKDKQRLYYIVFAKSDDLNDIASRWVHTLLRDNEDVAVMCLIQFFVDVAGYPAYLIRSKNIKEIVGYMEAHISDVIRKHDYIFKFDTNWHVQAQGVIFEFIGELLRQPQVIYKTHLITYFISFFKAMSLSEIRPLRHAGVVFALKFAVNCAHFLKTIRKQLGSLQESFISAVENVEEIQRQMRFFAEKRDVLSTYLKDLYAIIWSNYACDDYYLVTMRAMCAADLYYLLQALPDLFFRELKCIPMLIDLLSDRNKKVRASASKTLGKLFRTDKFKEYTAASAAKILKELHESIYDVDLNVAASVIDVITQILKTHPRGIPNETKRIIFCLVYHETYAYGKAAGNFLATYLRIYWGKAGEEEVIMKFVQFQHTSQMLDLIPTAVESVIEDMPELQSYTTIIDMLVKNTLEFQYAVTLLKVLRHTVSQIITGRSEPEQRRKVARRGVTNKDELDNIRCNLIPNLVILFERYRQQEWQEILISLLLACFSTKILRASHREDAKKIFKILQGDFFVCTARDTLDMISGLYRQVNDDLNPLKSLATAEAECCISKVIDTLHGLLNGHDHNSTSDEIYLLENTYLRLAVLYQHFDLSERGFNWCADLPGDFGKKLDDISLHHIESGCHKLVWQLRTLLESIDIEKMSAFKIECAEYLNYCFGCWDESKGVQAKVFWCVCDLLQRIHGELKELVKVTPELRSLYFDLESEQQQRMIDFLKMRVLHPSVADCFGHHHLGKFLNTAVLNQKAVPIEAMVPVFGCYFSLHKKYQEFFDKTLDALRAGPPPLLETFVLKVLLEEYGKLESKERFTSVENFNLGKLAVKFSLYLAPHRRSFEVLYFGLEHLVVCSKDLPFLRYLRYFVDPLKPTDRTKILEISRVALQDYKKNEHVTDFMRRIEAKYGPDRNVRTPSDTSASANVSVISESEISN